MSDYRPISCELYAELEVCILHRLRLRVAWRGTDGKRHLETLVPKDLTTRHHEEFLRAEDGRGRCVEIRLDRITRFEPLTGGRRSA